MNRFVALVVSGIAVSGSLDAAKTEFVTGNTLYGWCISANSRDICTAYVMGVVDQDAFPTGLHAYFCLRSEVTGIQLKDVVLKHLQEHPESRDLPASIEVNVALRQMFPCADPKKAP